MRLRSKLAVAVASFAAACTCSAVAAAAPMDPTPERMYLQPPGLPQGADCQSIASDPNGFIAAHPGESPNKYPCLPNNVAWANMMSELGYAIAPSAFHPARTTGFGGFALSLEASFAHINADAKDSTGTQYWHQGTQGDRSPNDNAFSGVDKYPDSILQIYTLKARKGLPLGFEITGALGYVANTTMWVGGADFHWAFLEGFRTGVLGYLPDMAIGAGVRTLSGTSKLYLTTVGIDGQVSKPITLGDSAVLTPYVGVQRLIIFADSAVVNLTPAVDPLKACGWAGTNPTTGQPVCNNHLSNGQANDADFSNQTAFDKARIHRWRGLVGATYRYEVLYLGGQFGMDLEDPSAEQSYITGDKQWTLSFEAGVFF